MLIPPSLLMIVYGVLAEVSIGSMFIAGVIPGIIIALGFAVMIWATATFFPERIMARTTQPELSQRAMPAGELVLKSVPIMALVVLILGGLYTGFFTPTEAGAVGAAGALILSLLRRRLDGPKFWRVLRETGLVSASILFLLIAAGLYSRMLAMAGVPVAEFAPRQIKLSVVGTGTADKDQVKFMVQRLLPRAGGMKLDAADALACAICTAHHLPPPLRKKGAA
jgi:TRAP-type C4-dicarboxylate transport system permease large subunit